MKVLIGCNGGLTGVYLAKYFKKMTNVQIIGVNSAINSCGKLFVDKQYTISDVNCDSFVDELISIINDEKIDYYFPTHSKEMRKVSLYQDEILKRTNCRLLVSDIEAFIALDNKREMNMSLNQLNIPVPKLITNEMCTYPIILKRDVGSGGNGMIEIENKVVHLAYMHTCKDISFYEKIEGVEYTADCLFDYDGKIIGINQRVREKNIGGAVVISKTDNGFDIMPYISVIANKWRLRGCVNFQYIISEEIPYFIDINLRFASGGLPLTVEQGFNIPELMIEIMENKNVKTWENAGREKRMYRYYEEEFEDL